MRTIPETNIVIRCLCPIREDGAVHNFLAVVKLAHVVKVRPSKLPEEPDRVCPSDLRCPVTRVVSMGRRNTKLEPAWH
jgi:hypothetical protein